jgi:hypothetical protein
MECRPGEGLGLAPAARRMYLINCLAAMQRTLAEHDCAASRADALGQVSGPRCHASVPLQQQCCTVAQPAAAAIPASPRHCLQLGTISSRASCAPAHRVITQSDCSAEVKAVRAGGGGACRGAGGRGGGGAAAPLQAGRCRRPHPLLPGR